VEDVVAKFRDLTDTDIKNMTAEELGCWHAELIECQRVEGIRVALLGLHDKLAYTPKLTVL